MKAIFLSIVLILSLRNLSKAQTVEEWTEQKKTQIKYLIEQIAALGQYMRVVEKGYDIAQKGLDMIHSIKKGDFDLHSDYFNSLKKVNPRIKAYWKVADILALQIRIITSWKKHLQQLTRSELFSPGELDYFQRVFTNLLKGGIELLDELQLVTIDGLVALKQDERIRRIDLLHERIKDQYEFEQSFFRETSLLALNRSKDSQEVQASKSLFGIR